MWLVLQVATTDRNQRKPKHDLNTRTPHRNSQDLVVLQVDTALIGDRSLLSDSAWHHTHRRSLAALILRLRPNSSAIA